MVEAGKSLEIFPDERVGLELLENPVWDIERVVGRTDLLGDGCQTGFGHEAELLEFPDALAVEFGKVGSFFATWGDALHCAVGIEFFHDAVDPAKAETFFDEFIVRNAWLAGFLAKAAEPDFGLGFVMVFQPAPPFGASFWAENFADLHGGQ